MVGGRILTVYMLALLCREGLCTSWVCTVQHGSHWSHVATEHLKCGQSELRYAVSAKYKLDFRISKKTLKKLHDDNLSVGVAIAPATQVIPLQNWAAFQSPISYSGHQILEMVNSTWQLNSHNTN